MPELPEVETTVRSLNRVVKGLRITDVWSNYNSAFHKGKKNIKDVSYFAFFKKQIVGKKILNVERRAKNIIINLSGNISVLVHMKMTGHFLFGDYTKKVFKSGKLKVESWEPKNKTGPLNDPMNRFIRMVWTLSNGKHLAFSDLRRFAKIHLLDAHEKYSDKYIKELGPEPLDKNFTFEQFKKRLTQKPFGRIKNVLIDQTILSGIGNIYSDEILWVSGIHPLSSPTRIPSEKLKKVYKEMGRILNKAIKIGGDSASDFRGIDGRPGGYQNFHQAYRQTGKKCRKRNCAGIITRLKIGGRSAHFCPIHQIKY